MNDYQTPTVADVDEDGNEVPRAQPGTVSISFRDQYNAEIQFRLKTTTKLGKAMDAFSAKTQQEPRTLRFLFEGQRVLKDSTMVSLEMEDGDVIDVHLEQIGGGEVDNNNVARRSGSG